MHSTMTRKKINDFPTFEENPSVAEVKFLRYPKYEKKEVLVVEKKTGATHDDEVDDLDAVIVGDWQLKDLGTFSKVFEGAELEIGELPSSAIRLLMFVMRHMPKDADEFQVDTQRCMHYLKYKNKVSVYDGIIGLLDAGFIYRKVGLEGCYYLNIKKIFKGRRQKLVKK